MQKRNNKSGSKNSKSGNFKSNANPKPFTSKNSRNKTEQHKPSFAKPRPEPKTPENGEIRLNKFLAHAGISSRREADNLIKSGLVEINGKVVTEMGYKVQVVDEVKFNGELIKAEKKIYLVLNKPKGFITTTDDPKARKTVMELVGSAGKQRFYPVGRLDRKTSGVLLFTNDGDLAKKLTHPSHGARKIYEVSLDKALTASDFNKIATGLTLEDGPIEVDDIQYIESKSKNNVGVIIHSGRNRIVRRIFESLGYEVTKLDRVFFAGITKKNLNRGQWRYLNEKEVSYLQMK